MEKIRVQKYISDCGLMSRRAAEKEIEEGNVYVNGEPAQLGQKILPGKDIVKYKGKQVRKTVSHFVYIMLNKPKGRISEITEDDTVPMKREDLALRSLLRALRREYIPLADLICSQRDYCFLPMMATLQTG